VDVITPEASDQRQLELGVTTDFARRCVATGV
jgi:hypothetical protein